MEEIITIYADDCSVFHNQEGNTDALQYFIANRKLMNIFHFEEKDKDDEQIAYFNYQEAKWYAGRLIGEASFIYKNLKYKIIVTPRFGNIQLFKMLEQIFNIRLSKSKTSTQKQNDYEYLIKTIISFLWLNLLSKANKHGIPRHNISKIYNGTTIKGKLDIRKSLKLIYTEKKIVSIYTEKFADETIAKIIASAFKILKAEYNLGAIKASLAAKNAIEQINASNITKTSVSELEYNGIQYKAIYLSFKPVVDLSWDIIKKKNFGNKDNSNDGISFFLDMAEIWEIYLRSILKKELVKDGWHLLKDTIITYPNMDFKRKLIPDIVFEKDKNIMVWDAKYKRMKFDYFDFDRTDFFQIHTYISFYGQQRNVFAAGLLYPISKEFTEFRQSKNKSSTLFSEGKNMTQYIVDGIDYTNVTEETIEIEEFNFLNRISKLAKTMNYE